MSSKKQTARLIGIYRADIARADDAATETNLIYHVTSNGDCREIVNQKFSIRYPTNQARNRIVWRAHAGRLRRQSAEGAVCRH